MTEEQKKQETFMKELREKVEELSKRAILKNYEPTLQETLDFNVISNIIADMSKWF